MDGGGWGIDTGGICGIEELGWLAGGGGCGNEVCDMDDGGWGKDEGWGIEE